MGDSLSYLDNLLSLQINITTKDHKFFKWVPSRESNPFARLGMVWVFFFIRKLKPSLNVQTDFDLREGICRLCGQKGETINHTISECMFLAQKEYKWRHDHIARLVHWKLCCKYDLSRSEKWYDHQPDGVVENERYKMLWEMNIQCDHVIEARRPHIVVVDKENNKVIIGITECMKRRMKRLKSTRIWRGRSGM